MNTWIFAGICDKSELLMYVCKMLAAGNYSVLFVDATEKRKYPSFIGRFDEPLWITEFSGFDVACGFDDEAALNAYLECSDGSKKYDYVIYDLEIPDFCSSATWREASARIWVTDYEIWTLENGGLWLQDAIHRHFSEDMEPEMHKVIVRTADEWFDLFYLEGFFSHLPICWMDDPLIMPWNELDWSVKLRNEHTRTVQMKPLTRGYKRKVCEMVQMLTGWDQKQIHRVLRAAERSRA
ncbi:hypothetical protein [Paenibacillus chibensis]|uniref:hypothetical protein n=1 Tax=Paenibacillus chibensis TaxID=59846 RepID=UPI000FD9C3E4|nr:hypothetical protein [Paenibacillus chibensis]MEC0371508.1 hypothetical protein [Paenibacillus chibensis]